MRENPYNDFIDCEANSACLVDPTLVSLWEVLFIELKQIAYYALKLRDFGYFNKDTMNTVLNVLTVFNTNSDFSHHQFKEIIMRLWEIRNNAQIFYEKICAEQNQDCEIIKSRVTIKPELNISELIKWGEQYSLMRNKLIPPENVGLYWIMLLLLKTVSENLLKIKHLDYNVEHAEVDILSILNLLNYPSTPKEKVIKKIKTLSLTAYELTILLSKLEVERYGKTEKVDVNASPLEGKAILAYTTDFKEFELLLRATQTKKINVYTYAGLLRAHAHKEFRQFPQLAGHIEQKYSPAADFAAFPGSVVIGKNDIPLAESLYRGRIFSTDLIAPNGIIRIKDYNFQPVLNSAFDSQGFVQNDKEKTITAGWDQDEIDAKIKTAVDTFWAKKLKMVALIEKEAEKEIDGGTFNMRINFNFTLIYYILEKLKDSGINVALYFEKCDPRAINIILTLLNCEFCTIYLGKCPLYVVNPHVVDSLTNDFGVRKLN